MIVAPPAEALSDATASGVREVSIKPLYLVATTRDFSEHSVLTVYRSVRTENTDSWMRPVIEELAGKCYDWLSADTYDDERMMGYRAVCIEYLVHKSCPGPDVPHTKCGVIPTQRKEEDA